MLEETVVDTRPTKIMYVAEATAHGGRDGFVTSQDGQIELKVAMPPALGGDGNGTNPEQLFAAGYSSCFHNALILVGNREGYDLTGSTVAAKVGIGPNKHRGYGLAVALSVSLPVLDADLTGGCHDGYTHGTSKARSPAPKKFLLMGVLPVHPSAAAPVVPSMAWTTEPKCATSSPPAAPRSPRSRPASRPAGSAGSPGCAVARWRRWPG